ncbi:Flagellar motor switch protein FliN [Novipirellula aureliae]|uniref:Flagellar motor switch protein FliN n=1 Tax=Novipirellula aureliae TaxID=2527966 RepID=A0A5C6E4B0_9BACT|nr:flagellar motor switch protein FliN [Novipirellula aureliae]TWU43324.1 Flagellar motor switch protein FliN [Novipirellula aureliae]
MPDPNELDEKTDDAAAAVESDPKSKSIKSPKSKDQEEHLGMDDIEKLLAEASGSMDQNESATGGNNQSPEPYHLGNLDADDSVGERQSIEMLDEVELDLRIELGRTQMRLEEVLQLRGGSVVALDKLAGDPVDIIVNGKLIARGEVLVMNDNFCIRVTELVSA